MKATLEFELPEEKQEHRHALNGAQYFIILDEIDVIAGGILKYGDPGDREQVVKALERIRALMPQEM